MPTRHYEFSNDCYEHFEYVKRHYRGIWKPEHDSVFCYLVEVYIQEQEEEEADYSQVTYSQVAEATGVNADDLKNILERLDLYGLIRYTQQDETDFTFCPLNEEYGEDARFGMKHDLIEFCPEPWCDWLDAAAEYRRKQETIACMEQLRREPALQADQKLDFVLHTGQHLKDVVGNNQVEIRLADGHIAILYRDTDIVAPCCPHCETNNISCAC